MRTWGSMQMLKSEAQQTKTLINAQRDEALRKQRERAGSFQPQIAATPAP